MKKAGRFATDTVTVFHTVKADAYGSPMETERLVLDHVMIVAMSAQGDSVLGNSPQNSAKVYYYPGLSTVNGCFIRSLRVFENDTLIEGEWQTVEEAKEAEAIILKVKGIANFGHIARIEHVEVLCG